MQGLDFWRFSEELTIVQAALLFTGHDPSNHPTIEGRASGRPEGYEAMKHSILSAIQKNSLDGQIRHESAGDFEGSYICPHSSTVDVESLKNWLHYKGVRAHPFYFPQDLEEEYLNEKHARYAPKLAAAIKAWKAMDDKNLYKTKSPKQAIQIWLRKNALLYGLLDDDGKPMESAIEEIAKIANWRPKGGAPSTPAGTDVNESKDNRANLDLKKPTKILESQYSTNLLLDDIDDSIPF